MLVRDKSRKANRVIFSANATDARDQPERANNLARASAALPLSSSQSTASTSFLLQSFHTYSNSASGCGPLVPTLPALLIFLDLLKPKLESNKLFLDTLLTFLPWNFFNLNADQKCDCVLALKNNPDIIRLFNSHWALTCTFLRKVIAQDKAREKRIMESELIYYERLNRICFLSMPFSAAHKLTMQEQQLFAIARVRAQYLGLPLPSIPLDDIFRPEQPLSLETLVDSKLLEELTIPSELICPLSGLLFHDPVAVFDGDRSFYFERTYISQYILKTGINPYTGNPLTESDLNPAPEISKAVWEFICKNMLMGSLQIPICPLSHQFFIRPVRLVVRGQRIDETVIYYVEEANILQTLVNPFTKQPLTHADLEFAPEMCARRDEYQDRVPPGYGVPLFPCDFTPSGSADLSTASAASFRP